MEAHETSVPLSAPIWHPPEFDASRPPALKFTAPFPSGATNAGTQQSNRQGLQSEAFFRSAIWCIQATTLCSSTTSPAPGSPDGHINSGPPMGIVHSSTQRTDPSPYQICTPFNLHPNLLTKDLFRLGRQFDSKYPSLGRASRNI
jgi:hypothetical protein